MIKNFNIVLSTNGNYKLQNRIAYPLYSELLKHVSPDFAYEMHKTGFTPISQYVEIEKDNVIWHLSLFGEKSINECTKAIDELSTFVIKNVNMVFYVKSKKSEYITFDDIINSAGDSYDMSYRTIQFVTPTSFKSGNQYAIFPSSDLILKNLLKKWNNYCCNIKLEDQDMAKILLSGVEIAGYRLSSAYYLMKGQRIRSFCGYIRLCAKLPAPIMQIYKALLVFSKYSGIGIKTALGMGGTKLIPDGKAKK
jgi:CRISPR-associated endoribonuclease Cas6